MGVEDDASRPIPLVDLRAEFANYGGATTAAMGRVAQSGQFIMGPAVSELELALSSYVQAGPDRPTVHCVSVSDGTAALQLCLMALKVGPGHEVVTTPFTWISSAEVIPLVGATPVFADIERDTYVIDVVSIKSKLTAKTRAVVVVSLYGLMPDLKGIREVLNDAEQTFGTQIALIEDGAQSFGSVRYGDRCCGSRFATMSTTSFFPTKPLSCYGDGGAVFTSDEVLAAAVRSLRVHGKTDGKHSMIGLNSRLDTLQAAVLLVKLESFPDMLSERRQAAERYAKLMQVDNRIVLPDYSRVIHEDPTTLSAWGVYTIRVEQRDAVMQKLKESNIGCAIYYQTPVHFQPAFVEQVEKRANCEVVENVCRTVLSLPMHAFLTESVQARIVRELFTALDDLDITSPPL